MGSAKAPAPGPAPVSAKKASAKSAPKPGAKGSGAQPDRAQCAPIGRSWPIAPAVAGRSARLLGAPGRSPLRSPGAVCAYWALLADRPCGRRAQCAPIGRSWPIAPAVAWRRVRLLGAPGRSPLRSPGAVRAYWAFLADRPCGRRAPCARIGRSWPIAPAVAGRSARLLGAPGRSPLRSPGAVCAYWALLADRPCGRRAPSAPIGRSWPIAPAVAGRSVRLLGAPGRSPLRSP
eukprot:gene15601-biopygen12677